jgi:hypothetical protein
MLTHRGTIAGMGFGFVLNFDLRHCWCEGVGVSNSAY